MTRRRCLTTADAVPAKGQHTAPCSDCPWARASLKGWTGGVPVEAWIRAAHGGEPIDCHTLTGARCAGAAIYRSNVCKRPRPGEDLFVLPADRRTVFASPREFVDHHSHPPAPPA